jgi:hypothetical protein
MNAVANLIVAMALLFSAGVVGKRTLIKLEAMALTRIQKGLPHLSGFTSRLTGLEYDKMGNIVPSIYKMKK